MSDNRVVNVRVTALLKDGDVIEVDQYVDGPTAVQPRMQYAADQVTTELRKRGMLE